MYVLKFAKALLHLSIVLGILRLFTINGFDLSVVGKLQNVHGRLFIFGFFGTLLSFEKLFSQYKYIPFLFRLTPLSFISGSVILVISAIIKSRYIGFYFVVTSHILFSIGGLLLVIYYFKNIFIHKINAPSQFLFLLGSAVIPIASLYSTKFTTLLEAGKPEFFLLFPMFVIVGERLDFIRIFTKSVLLKSQIVLGVLTFLSYIVALVTDNTYKIEKYTLFSLIINSFVAELFAMKHRFGEFKKIHKYMRVTLIIAYIFAIVGILLLMVRSFEPGFHSISLGFVFGMVFSHAIVIFPSIMAKKLPQDNQISYVPFIIFTISNVLRVSSSTVIYLGLLSSKVMPIFSAINIASGFFHFLSILLLFIKVKSIINSNVKAQKSNVESAGQGLKV